MNAFDITPTTFIIDINDPNFDKQIEFFYKFYFEHIPINL